MRESYAVAKSGDKIFRLPEDAISSFDATLSRSGMSQQELLARLTRWFVQQDEIAQAMILGQVPATPDLVEVILHRMADAEPAASPPGGRLGNKVRVPNARRSGEEKK